MTAIGTVFGRLEKAALGLPKILLVPPFLTSVGSSHAYLTHSTDTTIA